MHACAVLIGSCSHLLRRNAAEYSALVSGHVAPVFLSALTGLIEKPAPPDLHSMTSTERRTYALEVKHAKAHNLRFKRLRELMRTEQYDRLFASSRPKWPVYTPSQTQMQAAKIAARALKGMPSNANL